MEFSVICPKDGRVEVSLEDISSVSFGDAESVNIVFSCPQCGEEIRVTIRMSSMLVTSVDLSMFAEDEPSHDDAPSVFRPRERRLRSAAAEFYDVDPSERRRIDDYCEYFRRQLAEVDDVERMLSEIDSR